MTRSICTIEGCGRVVVGRGFCLPHYRRLRKHGDALFMAGITPGTVKAWLSSHAGYQEKDCLIFPFSKTKKGYGSIGFDGFSLAHQWMCTEVNGPAPEGKPFALHSCGKGTSGCVSPRHLYWGTGKENYADQVRHGVAAIGERCGNSVLTADAVRSIRRMKARGVMQKDIAKEFGVDPTTVKAVIKGITWSHVS